MLSTIEFSVDVVLNALLSACMLAAIVYAGCEFAGNVKRKLSRLFGVRADA